MNTKALIIVMLVIVAVGVTVYVLPDRTASRTAPSAKTFTLHVAKLALVEGPRTLSVRQGDTVSITITSDEKNELHLHGYDRSIDLLPDTPATLTFVADASGRFEYELEDTKTEIGVLEVLP